MNLAAKALRAQSDENAEQLLEQVEMEKQQEMEKDEEEKLEEIKRKSKEEVFQKMDVMFAKVGAKS